MLMSFLLSLPRILHICGETFLSCLVLFDVFLEYGFGFFGITSSNIFLNSFGFVVLLHSLILSVYVLHESLHGNLFQSRYWNSFWGRLLLWVNGGCYARFSDLAQLHLLHHTKQIDILPYNPCEMYKTIPRVYQRGILWAEWLYFPILYFSLQWRAILLPFTLDGTHNAGKIRIILILIVRGLGFSTLMWFSPKGLTLYFLCYITKIHVIRSMDAFQHTYESVCSNDIWTLRKKGREYELDNTYSLGGQGWLSKAVNLLILNFGYHTAHHDNMKTPWYKLPCSDAALNPHYISFSTVWTNYHRFRITRLLKGTGTAKDESGNLSLSKFYGAVDLSLLINTF